MAEPVMDFITQNVNNNTTLPKMLPLMHSCEAFDFEEIIRENQLKPMVCSVFNKQLLYFFYGKPSYPVGGKDNLNRTDALCCPVCLIIDLDKIDIYRVFPFDSGAFNRSLYDNFLHKHMKIEKFELDNNSNAIRSYISVVFGNNEN